MAMTRYLLFFTFFLSRGGSFRALIISEAALGTTSILACLLTTTCWHGYIVNANLFWMVNLTVTFNPFHSCVALAISSPTFFGDYAGQLQVRVTLHNY